MRRRFAYRIHNHLKVARLALTGEIGARKVRSIAFALTGGAVPLFQGGGPEPTMTTTAAVTAGRLVRVSGDRSIAPASASPALNTLGVAKQTADAVGDKVSVATSGVWMIVAQGAIAAGDQVVAGAAGDGRVSTLAAAAGATAADINAARAVVGKALAAAADAAECPILLGSR